MDKQYAIFVGTFVGIWLFVFGGIAFHYAFDAPIINSLNASVQTQQEYIADLESNATYIFPREFKVIEKRCIKNSIKNNTTTNNTTHYYLKLNTECDSCFKEVNKTTYNQYSVGDIYWSPIEGLLYEEEINR